MTIDQRREKFEILGKFLGQFTTQGIEKREGIPGNDPHFEIFKDKLETAVHRNGWFNLENVLFATEQWSKALTEENLEKWLSPYNLNNIESKTIAVVMAGNIPLVGFHDFLSVLICGHRILIKQSSNDNFLLPALADYLIALVPEWKENIKFVNNLSTGVSKMTNFDAVIATGSNNTARYFEYYFKDKPGIIRKNRNSVAILTGKETPEELAALGEDIFRYYGLGCRNVSKIYVPEDYNFNDFFQALYPWNPIINQSKYANNYDYNKAVYLMSSYKLLENGFLMLKEDESFGSPIATVFYERYHSFSALREELLNQKEKIQCIVSRDLFENEVPFGQTQHPQLWDYADNVDTLAFLTENL